jgi:hypothetical protein
VAILKLPIPTASPSSWGLELPAQKERRSKAIYFDPTSVRQNVSIPTHLPMRWIGSLPLFFQDFFGIDVDDDPNRRYPTFEEAFGILELADTREEGFKGFDVSGLFTCNSSDLI